MTDVVVVSARPAGARHTSRRRPGRQDNHHEQRFGSMAADDAAPAGLLARGTPDAVVAMNALVEQMAGGEVRGRDPDGPRCGLAGCRGPGCDIVRRALLAAGEEWRSVPWPSSLWR